MKLNAVPSAPTLTAVPAAPRPAFAALVDALSRGDDIDAALVDSVCRAAGKSVTDLADAIRARVAAEPRGPVVAPPARV